MNTVGHFKLSRKIFNNPVGMDVVSLSVFLYLLSEASWEPQKKAYKRRVIFIDRGQGWVTKEQIKTHFGIGIKLVNQCLRLFESEKIIYHKPITKTGRGGIIYTVCKYEEYQSNTGHLFPGNSNGTVDDTVSDTVKELQDKKIRSKEVKKEHMSVTTPLLAVWNDNCGDLPKVRASSKARNAKAKTRLKERPDLDEWATLIKNLATSEFVKQGSWACFDWVIKNETNHTKAFEGRYKNHSSASTKGGLKLPLV